MTSTPTTKRRAFPSAWPSRIGLLLLFGYSAYAISTLGISWDRMMTGMTQGGRFLSRMFPPDTDPDKLRLISQGIIESIQIAILSTFAGILISLPLGLAAARNLSVTPVRIFARGFITICRSFHSVVIAILFVKAVGFGALAGIMALIVATIGFVAKLFAEVLEEIDMKQVEAVRATGASFLGIIVFGVVPQVFSRFIGLISYQLDSNLRNSTMVGIVGGGGIGAALFTAYQRFDFDVVLTILIVIIAIIMLTEFVSGRIRKVLQ